MHILVTNDDGIHAEGIGVLVRVLKSMKKEDGSPLHEITVVAPEGERSGISHATTLRRPTKLRKLSEGTYSCSGTPADCVIVGGLHILGRKPDIVISGINRGPNLGTDIIYSGTCGAARQAALVNIPAIAASCASLEPDLDYMGTAAFIAGNLDALAGMWKPDTFVNVNAPSSPDVNMKGMWTVPGRNRYNDSMKCFDGPDGYTYCFLTEGRHERTEDEKSDHRAVEKGYVAVSLINIHPEAAVAAPRAGSPFPG